MRDYRFRGRSIEPLMGDDQWLYGFGVHIVGLTDGGKEYWLYTDNGTYQVDPETVGQYTGLRDSKSTEEYPGGQEIYEGDILGAPGNLSDDLDYIGYVMWDEEAARFETECKDTRFAFIPNEEVEVIGNIYEHPHLLNLPGEVDHE